MPAGKIDLVIDAGEDWTTQVIWTDHFDRPVPVIHPCRMDIVGGGATLITLETSEVAPPDGSIQSISLSTTTGLIQLHIPREVTVSFPPGRYHGDILCTIVDPENISGTQVQRLFYAEVTVNQSVTRL